jgi:hypothetical protein
MKDKTKSKKFDWLKALGDYNFTNAETATLTAMWNHADAETGYLWANLTHINEWCSRSPKSGRTPEHIKKAEELGLLTIGGHGRSRNYTLNLNIKPISKSSKSSTSSISKSSTTEDKDANTEDLDLHHGGLTPPPRRTNRSSNKPLNTSKEHTDMKETPSKRNLLKEIVQDTKGEVPVDYQPRWVGNHYPLIQEEAKKRYNFLISLGVEADLPYRRVEKWFENWVEDGTDPLFETAVILLGNNKVSDLDFNTYELKRSCDNMRCSDLQVPDLSGYDLIERFFKSIYGRNPNRTLIQNYKAWYGGVLV